MWRFYLACVEPSTCVVLHMKKTEDARDSAFFSGPLDPEEVSWILSVIDERLRLRAALNLPGPRSAATWQPKFPGSLAHDELLDSAITLLTSYSVHDLAAPLFNTGKGRRITRLVKALLNLPLRALGRPQLYFNQSVQRILSSCSQLLLRILEAQGELRSELAAQQQRLVEIGREAKGNASITRACGVDAESRGTDGSVSLGMEHRGLLCIKPGSLHAPEGGYVNIDARPLPGVHVVADVRNLPFEPGTVAEVLASHLISRFHSSEFIQRVLPCWYALLRPGGRLRIVCTNWQAALARHHEGKLSLERLHEITFGSEESAGNERLAMYMPMTLPSLLEKAGFVGCVVTVEERDNNGCPEMEVVGYRPRS